MRSATRTSREHDQLQQRLRSDSPRLDLGATPAGEGVDLHSNRSASAGLLRDEAISLWSARRKPTMNASSSGPSAPARSARKYSGGAEQHKDEIVDVLIFKNPFQFPMTTAPAMVIETADSTATHQLLGERRRGSDAEITRSLERAGVSREQEDSKANERVVVDDKNSPKIYLKGELTMSNHRKQRSKLHVRQSIRGTHPRDRRRSKDDDARG